jgi:Sodium/calcium exchanger protein
VLAAVTSLPNAVVAVYLAARGRGAATLSTALNSNTLNVAVGLLIPAALIGLGQPSGQTILAGVWYLGLTAVVLAFAYRDRGIGRLPGSLIIAAYLVFAGSVLGLAYAGPQAARMTIVAGLATAGVLGACLVAGHRPGPAANEPGPRRWPASRAAGGQAKGAPAGPSANGGSPESARARIAWPTPSPARQESLLPGWPVTRLWALGLGISFTIAVVDAVLGSRVTLIGLLDTPRLEGVKRRWRRAGAARRWFRRRAGRAGDRRGGCRSSGWRAGAAPGGGFCRGCGAGRSRHGRRVIG